MKITESNSKSTVFKTLKDGDAFSLPGFSMFFMKIPTVKGLGIYYGNCVDLSSGHLHLLDDDRKVNFFKKAELHLG